VAVFVDTSAFLAILNRDDLNYESARACWESLLQAQERIARSKATSLREALGYSLNRMVNCLSYMFYFFASTRDLSKAKNTTQVAVTICRATAYNNHTVSSFAFLTK
jgi:predicted nucleic acid-binding protein